ncbi:protein sprouty homolog 4-like [Arctopsyche grandis]|uniref:protein sprouty homolog 4-like n=1 Tax=Arctopsyche grandis TaxID=121162 RepID=UPI00406D9FA1
MEQHGGAPPRPAKPGRVERLERGARPGRPARPATHNLVTLATPRPASERHLNTYVDAPPRPPPPPHPHQHQHPHHQHLHLQLQQQQQQPPPDKHRLLPPQPPQQRLPQQPPVTVQPGAKRPPCSSARLDSILCERCGCCRCAQCAHPRPLPSKWLCSSCLCSAETAIDYTSCMCCAKALFYHCCNGDGGESATCADEPCSCAGGRRGARWSCLVALSFVLPCLLCYWPLKGAAYLCAGAYARVAHPGCRCAPHNLAPAPAQPY